jgi:hypothetical protein
VGRPTKPKHIPFTKWLPGNHSTWREFGAQNNGGITTKYRGKLLSIHAAAGYVGHLGVISGQVICCVPNSRSAMSDRSYLATFLQSYVDSQQQVMAQITEDLHERTSECV